MLIGLVIATIGTVITISTYDTASSFGGEYTVCYGAIIVGAWLLLAGMLEWLTNK